MKLSKLKKMRMKYGECWREVVVLEIVHQLNHGASYAVCLDQHRGEILKPRLDQLVEIEMRSQYEPEKNR